MEEKTKEKGNKKAEINKDKQLTLYFKKKSEIQYRGKRIPWPYTKKKFRNLVQRQMNTIREEKTEKKGNKKAEINQEYQI